MPAHGHARVRGSEGFTLLEVIFVAGLIAVLSGIAVPTILRGRAAANETAAVGTLRTVHTAQLTYALSCGAGLYAPSFPALVDSNGDGFLPLDLTASATPVKSGYTYTLEEGLYSDPGPNGCNGAPTTTEYYVSALPLRAGTTGSRAFATNQAHTIWQDTTGVAPGEPFDTVGTVSPIQ